jgi:hypothetical protein
LDTSDKNATYINGDAIFPRTTAGYTHLDIHKSHEEILAELKAGPVNEKLRRYR